MVRCFVPFCNSGYDYGKQEDKVSMFKVPSDRLQLWHRNISRKDKLLTLKDHVCEKHFEKQYIIREVKTEIYSVSM